MVLLFLSLCYVLVHGYAGQEGWVLRDYTRHLIEDQTMMVFVLDLSFSELIHWKLESTIINHSPRK